MARFSGKQGPGAQRRAKDKRRKEAQQRAARYANRIQVTWKDEFGLYEAQKVSVPELTAYASTIEQAIATLHEQLKIVH